MCQIVSSIVGQSCCDLLNQKWIDKIIQKAFISKINGTIEHNQILSEIIQHSKANRCTLHTTCLDLEDVFDSVQHELISIGLECLGISEEIQSYIK